MQTKSEMINRIAELAKGNAALKAENVEIKTRYINFIAKLNREMITKDDIQDLKDTVKRFVEERNSLRKENAELKAENERLQKLTCFNCGEETLSPSGAEIYDKILVYKQTLQEIKKIAEIGLDKYHNGLILAKPIIDLINKAEEE